MEVYFILADSVFTENNIFCSTISLLAIVLAWKDEQRRSSETAKWQGSETFQGIETEKI